MTDPVDTDALRAIARESRDFYEWAEVVAAAADELDRLREAESRAYADRAQALVSLGTQIQANARLRAVIEDARRTSGKDWPIGSCINGHSAAALQPIKRRAKDGSPRWGRTCSECVKLARHRYNERKRAERKEAA